MPGHIYVRTYMHILVDSLVAMCPGTDIDKSPIADPIFNSTNLSTSTKRSEATVLIQGT